MSDAHHDLVLAKSHQGKRFKHLKFKQQFKGLPVFEGEAITHVDAAGNVSETSALRNVRADLDITPTISSETAIEIALDATEPGEGVQTKATLEVLPRGDRSSDDRLVWHVTIFNEGDDVGAAQWDHFIDAHTRDLVLSFDSLETSASTATGKSLFSGDQTLSTDTVSGVTYLRDIVRSAGNVTCDKNNKTNAPVCSIFSTTSATPVFGSGTVSNRATVAADAHFGLQKTWDFYKSSFGRNGIDGTGRSTTSRVHYGRNYVNAFWSNSCFCMTYGDGNGSTYLPLVSLDITGHEMSHGVMATEANLTYSGESGGLNESNSDIFGTMVEYYANTAKDVPDYLIGEAIYASNWVNGTNTNVKALRYMADPAKDGISPACWSSTIGSLDVHYSSGPNNHMFYLLAEGGTSKCNGNVVTGIGRAKAAAIWYNAISNYMTSSTNYHGARTAAVASADELYGVGSAESSAVAAAFAAINVN